MASSKTCKRCAQSLAIDRFYKHAQMKDGHLNICIDCVKFVERQRRISNIDRVREYDKTRAKLPHRIERTINNTRRRRMEEPGYSKAHNAVSRAVKLGLLTKTACERCGRTDSVHAHHDNYEKPLDVMWLCPPCHSRRHKELQDSETITVLIE